MKQVSSVGGALLPSEGKGSGPSYMGSCQPQVEGSSEGVNSPPFLACSLPRAKLPSGAWKKALRQGEASSSGKSPAPRSKAQGGSSVVTLQL